MMVRRPTSLLRRAAPRRNIGPVVRCSTQLPALAAGQLSNMEHGVGVAGIAIFSAWRARIMGPCGPGIAS
ncbi:hypothetical protein B0T17DRAFT_524937 [Bombardia bombarda]|uniref:Uncharacterized protein n=1 Tax=Bombardia bombarda TaxID=252184 RepID=A0AA39X8C6_9PEZI|nr:hypothetical protein B0T17DRAFT_524937 [Bombardia bombarda]